MNGNVIRTITIRGTSEGLDKLQADVNKVAAGHKGVTLATEETEQSSARLEQALKRQVLRLDEVARAQSNVERETRLANKGVKEGLIDQQQATRLIELANQRYGTAAKATAEVAKQTGLARHELINLGRQAQDVGVSLASGQSPFSVLVQQGTQIADVFATSGGTLRGFFTQAIGWAKGFLTSTGGIVTAVLAIGGAAIYAASQFARASTTIEEALKEQNRLLKEGKALIDERTSAEARAQLQSKDQTEFETKRNLVDLQLKLNKAMEDTAKLAASRATTPTGGGMPEMGEAPMGFAPLKDPGLDKITDAFLALNAAREAGLPGLRQFNEELSRIGMLHPELANTVEDLIKAGRAGIELEHATLKARAMSDALAGIATNAQLAAVGLGSIAQFNLNNLMAAEAALATERMAVATMDIVKAYPGITAETAKTLVNLTSQMTTQEQNNVKVQLEGDFRRINATYQEKINQLLQQGLILTTAVADAEQNRQAAIKAAVKDATDLNSLMAQQVDYAISAYEKEQGITTTYEERANVGRDLLRSSEGIADASEFGSAAAGRYARNAQEAADAFGRAAQYAASIAFWAEDMHESIAGTLDMLKTQGGDTGTGTFTPDPMGLVGQKKSMVEQYGMGNLVEKSVPGSSLGYWTGEKTYYEVKPTTHQEIMDRAKARQEEVDRNTEAVKANTAATQTMTDVLSPYYSSDPRRTHLGFRAFAGGGIMTAHGELPLKHYQGGGVASSPQVAVYGEGSTPEAYVPVPSGRIPVEIKQPANSNRPVVVNINVMGNTDANTVSALKATAFQQAQAMRRAMR